MILSETWSLLRGRGKHHVATAVMVFLCASGRSTFATPWVSLNAFEGDRASMAWRSDQGPKVRAQSRVMGHYPGIRLLCPMGMIEDRCYWDAEMHLDLSGATEIAISICTTQPSAISRCSIHFRSGNGWYGGWFKIEGSDWQTITLPRRDFGVEGEPVGWDVIEGVRFSAWKGGGQYAIVSLANMRSRCDDVIVLRNSNAMQSLPDEIPAINRAVDRVSLWFEEGGLSVGQLNDHDVKEGIPTGARIAVLPYNPDVPETTVSALTTFVAQGGRVIAAYNLPSGLASVLGLERTTWAKAGPIEQFSSIRLDAGQNDGFPPVIRQNSWNANIPILKDAEVIGYWQNGAGVTSAIPAVTINTNGAFIGHVLTNTGRERKTQFLVALAAKLQPQMKDVIFEGMMDRAQRLSGFSDGSATRAFIRERAEGAEARAQAESRLKRVELICDASSGAPTNNVTLGALLLRADEVRTLTREAYFNAVSNRGVTNEFRGVWCHAAEGVVGMRWDDTVVALKHAGFNALFANMLWAGKAYYPSLVVPVAKEVREQGDLLAQCLSACRKNKVELHVWKVCWNLLQASPAFVEEMRATGRLQQKADGTTRNWLCPSDPRNRDLELSAVVEVARNYNVAGIHLDYIRYPDADGCYCEGCQKRFVEDTGITVRNWPGDVISGSGKNAFLAWRRDQITTFVAQASEAIKSVRDTIKVSAAVFPSWPSCRESLGQDWVSWTMRGIVDFVCPMNYEGDAAKVARLTANQLTVAARDVPVYPGVGPSAKGLTPDQIVHQVDLIREAGAKGFVLFELDQDLLDIHLPTLRIRATAD